MAKLNEKIQFKEIAFRVMLREKLVDTGFCEVTQWRNFSDAIKLIIEKSNLSVKEQKQ